MNAKNWGAAVLLTGTMAMPAMADDVYYDTAQVIAVTPRTERINSPRQECHTEYVREYYSSSGDRDIAGAIIGGIAGGLLGSQIGKGNGKVAGAAVGAATGAIVGDRIDNSDRREGGYRTRPVEHCTMVDNWQTVIRNYLVTYRYNGRLYTTTLPSDPGDTLRVRIAITPDYDGREVIGYVPGYARDNGWHRGWGKHRRDRWDD
ncbi:MAG: glycine zipper 2TM domain-containing protein [Methylophilaceae bacterium]|nr:glycine zipper 2TM domain-containing protein [Methylophilaceae bacterium]